MRKRQMLLGDNWAEVLRLLRVKCEMEMEPDVVSSV